MVEVSLSGAETAPLARKKGSMLVCTKANNNEHAPHPPPPAHLGYGPITGDHS